MSPCTTKGGISLYNIDNISHTDFVYHSDVVVSYLCFIQIFYSRSKTRTPTYLIIIMKSQRLCVEQRSLATLRVLTQFREGARAPNPPGPMASSEIEVVEDATPAATSGGAGRAVAEVARQEGEGEALKDDVYTGAAYGDLEKLHRLVEREGRSVTVQDALGYHALQWAALNNRVATAQYILEVGAPSP
jgi:hypothetical protein